MNSSPTVIIPVHDQAFSLNLTLYGFENQNPPYDQTPIIVVDDGSTQPIEPVVVAHSNRLNIRYLRIEHGGRAVARNCGVNLVHEGTVIFCDADRIPRPDFIQAYVQAFKTHDGITVGQVREMYVSNPEQNKSKILDNYNSSKNDRNPQYYRLIRHLFSNTGEILTPLAWVGTLSGNMALPVRLYKDLGGFDEKFQTWGFEHFEFGYRAWLRGVLFRYEEHAVNVHIAHPRSKSYKELITESHAYFYKKHSQPVVLRFLDFMLGQISLYELLLAAESEEKARGGVSQEILDSLYVEITNM